MEELRTKPSHEVPEFTCGCQFSQRTLLISFYWFIHLCLVLKKKNKAKISSQCRLISIERKGSDEGEEQML